MTNILQLTKLTRLSSQRSVSAGIAPVQRPIAAASVARMSKATSGADLSSIDPVCRCAHAGYLLFWQ
jgi:hypothetical protein